MGMRIFGKFAVVYLLAGQGSYSEANGPRVPVRAGDLIFVYPEVAHGYGPPVDGTWEEFYIVFDGPVFDAWRTAGLIGGEGPIVHLEPVEYWLRRLITAAGEPTGGDLAAGLDSLCRMQQLLADIVTTSRQGEGGQAWLSAAKVLIDAIPLDSAAALNTVSRQLGMPFDTFRKRFAKLSGMTPSRSRTTRAIDAAANMLVDPRLTLATIAERCGFCDAFHFSKRFKQIVGVSPAEFRRRSGGR
jgi:AraC-like DNA-binding protein